MAWFRVDDQFYLSRKVLSIPRRWRNAAVGLWSRAGSWTSKEELDGFVPDFMPEQFDDADGRLSGLLVASGLWLQVDGGFQFANFTEYQMTRVDHERLREQNRQRKRAQRAREAEVSHAHVTRDTTPESRDGHVRSPHTHPNPSHSIPDTTKTYVGQSHQGYSPVNATDGVLSVDSVAGDPDSLAGDVRFIEEFGEVYIEEVRAGLYEVTDYPPGWIPDAAVSAVVSKVGERAGGPKHNPTGYVIAAIRRNPSEWESIIQAYRR